MQVLDSTHAPDIPTTITNTPQRPKTSNTQPHAQFKPNHYNSNIDVSAGPISIKWFEGGTTNLCYNALDVWVQSGAGDRACFVWEGNDHERKSMTYKEVLAEVCKLVSRCCQAALENRVTHTFFEYECEHECEYGTRGG